MKDERNMFFFQAEMYAINRLANIIKEKDIKNKTIYILSDSKSSLQALEKDETCSNLIKETKSNLNLISEKNNVYLIKIPAHTNIFGNEMADKLAKEGALMTREKTELKNGFKTIINEIEDILFKEHVKNIKRTKIIERNKKKRHWKY